jgi:hypothetical protein
MVVEKIEDFMCYDALKNTTSGGCDGNWAVIIWVGFVAFFEYWDNDRVSP